MGSIHQNGDRLREPKVGDTRRPAVGRGHGDEWIDCVGSMSAESSSCPTIIFHCRSLPVIPRCGHQMCSVLFLWGRGLQNRQKPLRVIFLPSLACRDQSQINDLDRGPVRASFLYMHCEPQELFFCCCCCCVNRSTFHKFPFFFFLLYSSVAKTLKNVGPLDCKLR